MSFNQLHIFHEIHMSVSMVISCLKQENWLHIS